MDHAKSHADHRPQGTAHADTSRFWRLIIPHITWRTPRDYRIVDRELDLPDDNALDLLAERLGPGFGRVRPQHPVWGALLAERHFCRWAKMPMHWRDRTTARHVYRLPDGEMAAVAGRWLPYTGELPRTIAIPYNGIPDATLVVAVAHHDNGTEPVLLGWHTTDYWKTHGTRTKIVNNLSGRMIPRDHLLPMHALKQHLHETQQTLF